jgi:hypothetical protein
MLEWLGSSQHGIGTGRTHFKGFVGSDRIFQQGYCLTFPPYLTDEKKKYKQHVSMLASMKGSGDCFCSRLLCHRLYQRAVAGG